MAITRKNILREYKDDVQGYNNISIDLLCRGNSASTFELQTQQKFFKKLVNDHPNIRELLLYHGIGSGKTLTSITIAEEYMNRDTSMKSLVILPARLKTNFYNELMFFSAYGNGEYINQQEYIIYISASTSNTIKKNIYTEFINKVSRKYTVISFERFRIDALKSRKPRDHLVTLSRNKVIIIDEVHNLINFRYKKEYLDMITSNILPRSKVSSIGTLLLKTMLRFAEAKTRFVFLTATPVFDNIRQFAELVKIMNPQIIDLEETIGKKITGVKQLMPFLAGKVSYFPGSSVTAYPSVSYISHDIEPSEYQMNMCQYIRPFQFTSEEPNNGFFSLERRAAIFAYIDNNEFERIIDTDIPDAYKKSFEEILPLALRNPTRYMSKINALINNIENMRGKQLVYSNFIQYGVNLVAELLKQRGWVNIKDVINGNVANPQNYKCYATWDGITKNTEKDAIKSLANSIENIDGKLLRVVIGSPAMKEGVSFKHIQDYHLLDPVWNQSTKTQVEGRAIRFCSHYDIPLDHPFLKRHVNVHIYKLKYPNSPNRGEIIAMKSLQEDVSIDAWIYDNVIHRKNAKVSVSEAALRKVAFDYYLFRKLYRNRDKNKKTPSSNDNAESIFSLSEENQRVDIKNKEVKDKAAKNMCLPKQRRPPCKDGYEERLNKYYDPCCYKKKK